MARAVGIDFGTTNSVISVLEGGEPVVISNHRGERLTPSVVSFGKDGDVLVGTTAKNQAVINHERTISSVKRGIGEDVKFKIDSQEYTPVQIASIIIGRLKEYAEEFLCEPVKQAIITVPAYFNDSQRQAVKRAGETAGLEVLRLINEPTAAALAYGLPKSQDGRILVFDLGGGTFDVSILDVSGSVYEVLATRGDNKLGGDDFDAALVRHICAEYNAQSGIDLTSDRMAMQKIKDAAEQAKKELSESTTATISIPFISADESGPKHLEISITRYMFEGLIGGYLEEINELVDLAIEDAGTELEQVDAVVLVGGSSRIPAIQQMLEEKFGNRVLRNANPDECVAAGAAIQAGIMSGSVTGLVLVDVTPLTLGIETENDVFVPIIDRNSCIPTSKSRVFTTVADNQTSVEVHVLQGERVQASKNHSLGKFSLEGIPIAPRGYPRIEVIFDIDVNGIVHVRARDEKTGNCRDIEINARGKLSEDEIEKLLQEASAHRDEDELFQGRQQLVKQARVLLEHIKTRSRANPSDPHEDGKLLELVEYIETVLSGDDAGQLRKAVESMNIYLNDMVTA
ncbi:MAG TPA: molecular chaperone DnaK [bacterium]|nr:molecular chaperone DnaK [bacterium]